MGAPSGASAPDADPPSPEYEIRPVTPGDVPDVAGLLPHLTGRDADWNRRYLTWKYLDNPFVDRPLGIVTRAGNRVVGFRGYHATPWCIPGTGLRTLVLSPGDTCVHPEHRRRGLSVRMGSRAMDELHPDHRIFLNMTAGASSVPGYLRMGFVRLHDKSRLIRLYPLRLVSSLIRPGGGGGSGDAGAPGGVRPGEYGNVEVSLEPRPEAMASVAMEASPVAPKLTPLQEARFFRWYFRAPGARHVFYYLREEGQVTGYVVVRLEQPGRLATIVDYSRHDAGPVVELLRFLVRSKPAGILWIYAFTPSGDLRSALGALGFREESPLERLRRRANRVWPLLVRPVRPNPLEEDWFIGDLDIRRISSWEIPEIRSDAI